MSRPGRTRTCAHLFVGQASWPLDDGTKRIAAFAVAEVGVEPTSTSLSDWRLCLFAYPAVIPWCRIAGTGVEPRRAEFMRLGRAPAHPPLIQSQAPVSSRARRPHEGRSGTSPAWGIIGISNLRFQISNGQMADDREQREHSENRSGPCGSRTRLSSVRGWRPGPIDQRAIDRECAGQESNLHSRWRVGYSHLGSPMPSRRESPAPPMGFEPTVSWLTTRRGRPAPLQGREHRTEWPRRESNPQTPASEAGGFAGLPTGPDPVTRSGSRGTRTHKRDRPAARVQDGPLIRPVGFRRTASSSGGWNRTSDLHVQGVA